MADEKPLIHRDAEYSIFDKPLVHRFSDKLYTTKDSGQRENFATGARRDVQEGKPRYGLIPVAMLKRLAALFSRGAVKYGENNYQKGIPFMRVYESLLRHVYSWAEGDESEDHLAAVCWNAMALMFYQEQIAKGKLSADLDDRVWLNAPLNEEK